MFNGEMLNKISFINEDGDMKLEFYNSTTGKDIGYIICENIFIYNFNANFLPEEERFPCLIQEVYISELNNDKIQDKFKELNYAYSYSNGIVVPESDEHHFLKLEGGPIYITVVCGKIEIIKK